MSIQDFEALVDQIEVQKASSPVLAQLWQDYEHRLVEKCLLGQSFDLTINTTGAILSPLRSTQLSEATLEKIKAEGVDVDEVETVMDQTKCDADRAIDVLKRHKNIVDAMLEIAP